MFNIFFNVNPSIHRRKCILIPFYLLEAICLNTINCIVTIQSRRFHASIIFCWRNSQTPEHFQTDSDFLRENPHYKNVVVLPERKCVSTCHTGDYLSIDTSSYERLLKYCRINHMTILSDAYEFAINDYLSAKDENAYITRILFYVK